MIVTTHLDAFATSILEALSEAAADYAVHIGPDPSGGYLIELHDLAESTETPCKASGADELYAVAVAKVVVNLLAPGHQLVRPACPIAPPEPVELPRLGSLRCPSERFDGQCIHRAGHDGKHSNERRSWIDDPTPPHGIDRPLETRAHWTERAS